ncbi:hypothetical protein GF358_03115 [Candidatus Woesearchaeota archaeon]|nr:hypothetical protein [Candidatus Woesearchaeota archaeon]
MKKKVILLFILSLFLVNLLAGTVQADAQGQIESGITKFTSMIEFVLGGIFKAVINEPNVWLRVLFFIAIYAVLFKIIQTIDVSQKFFDRKTAGIIGFVLSFGTVAIMPVDWLFFTLTMYGGIIIMILMGIPAAYLAIFTKDEIMATSKSRARLFLVAILWIVYLMIISTVFSSIATASAPNWQAVANVVQTETFIDWFSTILYSIAIIAIITSVLIALFSTERREKSEIIGSGTKAASYTARRGASAFQKILAPFRTTGKTPGIDLSLNVQNAISQYEKEEKEECKESIENALAIFKSLQNLHQERTEIGRNLVRARPKEELSDANKNSFEKSIEVVQNYIAPSSGTVQKKAKNLIRDINNQLIKAEDQITKNQSPIPALDIVIDRLEKYEEQTEAFEIAVATIQENKK